MRTQITTERNIEQKTQDFLSKGKCFNNECKNKNINNYIKHGKRDNKSGRLKLFKCVVCSSVFGIPQDQAYGI